MPLFPLKQLTHRRRGQQSNSAKNPIVEEQDDELQGGKPRRGIFGARERGQATKHDKTTASRPTKKQRRFFRINSIKCFPSFLVLVSIIRWGFSQYMSGTRLRSYRFGDVDLVLTSLRGKKEGEFRRKINPRDAQLYNRERLAFLRQIDKPLVDVENRHYYEQWEDRNFDKPPLLSKDKSERCVPPKWVTMRYPSCHTFHEISLGRSEDTQLTSVHYQKVRYLAHGHFRNAFMLSDPSVNVSTLLPPDPTIVEYPAPDNTTVPLPIVLKQMRYHKDLDFIPKLYVKTNREAVVLNAFTASERFGEIYGYCGTSTLVEAGSELVNKIVPRLDRKYQPKDGGSMSSQALDDWQHDVGQVGPPRLNNLTLHEKLVIAIAMVESIAEMHGFEKGVIIHNDIQPEQWMVSPTGRIFLNDVNQAHALAFSVQKQKYCPVFARFDAKIRAPEENEGGPLVETSDRWGVGNQLYSLLTGLSPYYNMTNVDNILRSQRRRGVIPSVPRWNNKETSFVEREMMNIIQQCYRMKPSKRMDIFSVRQRLQEIKQTYKTSEKSST